MGLFPILENSACVMVAFDNLVSQHAELVQLRSVVDFGKERDSVFVFACKLLLVEGCNVTIEVRNLLKVSSKYEYAYLT